MDNKSALQLEVEKEMGFEIDEDPATSSIPVRPSPT